MRQAAVKPGHHQPKYDGERHLCRIWGFVVVDVVVFLAGFVGFITVVMVVVVVVVVVVLLFVVIVSGYVMRKTSIMVMMVDGF